MAAATAIVLSQLPPIKSWFRRAKLDVEIYGKAGVSHMLGYPNLSVLVGIRNVGGKGVRIRAAKVRIARQATAVAELEGLQYFPTPTASGTVVFTPFFMKADGEWIHTIQFLGALPQVEDRALGQLRADVRLDIAEKAQQERVRNPQNPQVVEAAPELIQRMEQTFEAQFLWTPGEYSLQVEVMAEGSELATCKYRFTLFESDTEILRKQLERYRIGGGVAIDDSTIQPIWASLSQ